MPRSVSRRTTLAASAMLAGASLAGCSLRPTPPAAAPAPTNPDQPLVDALTMRISNLLPTAPAPWYAAHRAQLRALGARPHVGPAGRSGASGTARLPAERALHDALVDGAVRAQAPALVRLLTSLAAGQAQLLARA